MKVLEEGRDKIGRLYKLEDWNENSFLTRYIVTMETGKKRHETLYFCEFNAFDEANRAFALLLLGIKKPEDYDFRRDRNGESARYGDENR